jgi:hypothetical protein
MQVHERRLAFTAPSPQAFLDAEMDEHPLWVTARRLLEVDQMRAIREHALKILTAANELPGDFRVTTGYIVAIANRTDP